MWHLSLVLASLIVIVSYITQPREGQRYPLWYTNFLHWPFKIGFSALLGIYGAISLWILLLEIVPFDDPRAGDALWKFIFFCVLAIIFVKIAGGREASLLRKVIAFLLLSFVNLFLIGFMVDLYV